MNYKKVVELEGKTLQKGDLISLWDIPHEVRKNHLKNLGNCGNDWIFNQFIENVTPEEICRENYGYEPVGDNDGFPKCEKGDFEALTRLVISLMKLSES